MCVCESARHWNYFWLFHYGIIPFGAWAPSPSTRIFCISSSISYLRASDTRRNVCGAAIDRKNLFTQHWRGAFTCFIIFKTRTEGKRSNLIFLWDIFLDTRFFPSSSPYAHWTRNSIHRLFSAFIWFMCCCITSIVFRRRQRQKKKKLWPKTASEKARKFLLFSLVSYSIQS